MEHWATVEQVEEEFQQDEEITICPLATLPESAIGDFEPPSGKTTDQQVYWK